MSKISINLNDAPVRIFADDKSFADAVCDMSVQGRHPLTLESTTVAKHNKFDRMGKGKGKAFTECFKGEVFCTKKEYVSYGLSYQDTVNRQLVKEGKEDNFTAQELPWGNWYGNAHTVIEHKGNYYLRYTLKRNANAQYSEYIYHYEDGTLLTDEEVELFFDQFASVKSTSSRQGTDDVVEVRCVKVSGIARASVNGTTYVRKEFQSKEENNKLTNWIAKAVQEVERKAKETLGNVA